MDKSKNIVSIIIPAYNCSSRISSTINSALSQKEMEVEVIVVDDCSNDNTERICRSFGNKIIYYRFEENRGGPAARNKGVSLSNGRWISFLDSDDYFFENKTFYQINQMREKGYSFSFSYAYDDFDRLIGRNRTSNFFVGLLNGDIDIVSSSGIVVTRELFDKLFGFDESFKRKQDIEFSLRASLVVDILCIEVPLYRKINSGSPRYINVKQGVSALYEGFSYAINMLSNFDKKRIYAYNEARLFELSLKEMNPVFIKHFILSVGNDYSIFFSRFVRYINKIKLLLRSI